MKKKEYEVNVLKYASALDETIGGNRVISQLASNIIETLDDNSTKKICLIIDKLEDSNNAIIISNACDLKKSLIEYFGFIRISDICQNVILKNDEDEHNLDTLLVELEELVGLVQVKSKVQDLLSFYKVQQLRKQVGLVNPQNTLHLVFTGNPGTGKTTVARIVGRLYKHIGLLSQGHFLEVSRTDLIAGYQGQTALKVKKVIEKAKGGVLFIDEAYSITENEHSDSYGRECLTELTKALEDYRNDLVVIVAGYTEPMKKFLDSNPGLKSRFNSFIEFDDYSADELLQILKGMCNKEDYYIPNDVLNIIKQKLIEITLNKDEKFANGRFVRNLFEDMIMNHARRVSKIAIPTCDELKTIVFEDLPKVQ